MKRLLVLALILILASVAASADKPLDGGLGGGLPRSTPGDSAILVTLNVNDPDLSLPAHLVGWAQVTQTTSNNPRVLKTLWPGVYDAEAGIMSWYLPPNCQVHISVQDAGIDGTYTLGGEDVVLNDLLAVQPSQAPGWAGPLAPLLAIPPLGSLIGSTGTACPPSRPAPTARC